MGITIEVKCDRTTRKITEGNYFKNRFLVFRGKTDKEKTENVSNLSVTCSYAVFLDCIEIKFNIKFLGFKDVLSGISKEDFILKDNFGEMLKVSISHESVSEENRKFIELVSYISEFHKNKP